MSLVAALVLSSGADFTATHRTLFVLISWSQRTFFWVGLIFVAGAVLEHVYGPRHNP